MSDPTGDARATTGGAAEAVDPDRYLQGEAVTLVDVLDQFGAEGYQGQFDGPRGKVRCLTCRRETDPADVPVERMRRLEGASDPADMLAVVALRCPHCATSGTLVLNYGPESTPEEADILAALPEPAAGT